MTKPLASSTSDADFYLPADRFFAANLPNALTFDDVSLATLHSEILPKDTDLATSLAEGLRLQIPIISSDMDTVTESRMAIAMALNGGLGLIHYNLPGKDQIKEVARVKRHIHGLIQDPITVAPGALVSEVLAMIDQKRFDFRTFPVVDDAGKLVGLLSGNLVKDRYKSRKGRRGHDAPPAARHSHGKADGRRPDQGRRQVFHGECRHPQGPRRGRQGSPPRPGDHLRH
jgi:IMP dehydrogenase